MGNWIEVYKINKRDRNLIQWLYEIMEEEKIPYKEEIVGNCFVKGKIPQYEEYIVLYVLESFKDRVEEYINSYNNPENIIYEESPELRLDTNEENEFNIETEKVKKNKNIIKKGSAWLVIGMFLTIIFVALVSDIFINN